MATLEEVLREVQKNGRVCPQPMIWNELYDMLPSNVDNETLREPS
jgi:hypothetical protein